MGRIARRQFLTIAGAAAVARGAFAQPAAPPVRIAVVDSAKADLSSSDWTALRGELRELGHVEGTGFVIDVRSADGVPARLPTLVAAALATRPAVIVATDTPAALAAKKATTTVPIVFLGSGDPVGAGLVGSLGRPEGNVTGFSLMATQVSAKWVEALLEFVPRARQLAFLGLPGHPAIANSYRSMQDAARARGVDVRLLDAGSTGAIDRAFDTMGRERIDGFAVAFAAEILVQRDRIIALAARVRLPAVYPREAYADAGGLLAIGEDSVQRYRRAAVYVHRILQGTKPGDLPVEQPTRLRIVVNLRTARQLGLAVPPSLRLLADRVIE